MHTLLTERLYIDITSYLDHFCILFFGICKHFERKRKKHWIANRELILRCLISVLSVDLQCMFYMVLFSCAPFSTDVSWYNFFSLSIPPLCMCCGPKWSERMKLCAHATRLDKGGINWNVLRVQNDKQIETPFTLFVPLSVSIGERVNLFFAPRSVY